MAKIAVLGTGDVGQQIGKKLVELGHEVRLGSRTASNEKALAWAQSVGDNGGAATFADAVAFSDELVFFCAMGGAASEILGGVGADALRGKVIVDVSNPLDFSKGFPPSLSVCNTTSLAEQIQEEFPAAHVVKALNTVANPLMVNPGLLPEPTDLFVCGNDDGAKQKVTDVLRSFGWERITDVGDLSNARGLEAWLLLWTRLFGKLQTPLFNIKLVRAS